jgi:hypothetical protein
MLDGLEVVPERRFKEEVADQLRIEGPGVWSLELSTERARKRQDMACNTGEFLHQASSVEAVSGHCI